MENRERLRLFILYAKSKYLPPDQASSQRNNKL